MTSYPAMRRALGVFVLVLVWFALFDVPSAVAICRHAPWWLATAIGGVCLVAPFAWQLIGERKKKKEGKSTLSGWDRLILRTVVVGVLVGFGSWAVAKPDLWTALKHHWDWMFPRSNTVTADSKLLKLVPSDATGVLWVRAGQSPELTKRLEAIGRLPPDEAAEAVIAMSRDGKDVMIAASGDHEVIDGVSRLVELGNALSPHTLRDRERDGATVWATPRWDGADGGSPSLTSLIERAPADAMTIVVSKYTPTKSKDRESAVVGWLRAEDDRLEGTMEIDAGDEPTARSWLTDFEVGGATTARGQCFAGAWTGTVDGSHITLHLDLDLDAVPALVDCLK